MRAKLGWHGANRCAAFGLVIVLSIDWSMKDTAVSPTSEVLRQLWTCTLISPLSHYNLIALITTKHPHILMKFPGIVFALARIKEICKLRLGGSFGAIVGGDDLQLVGETTGNAIAQLSHNCTLDSLYL
jgi:hypothetical protein